MKRLLVAAIVLLALGSGPVAAQDTGWVIESFAAIVVVQDDGTLVVTEEIAVDFRGLSRRGIFRNIPVRQTTGDPDVLRAIDISGIRVDSTAPDDIHLTRPNVLGGTDLVIRIGDPDVTVTGRQQYRISYRVQGALTSFDEHEELYWNATGDGWPVPIQRASLLVSSREVTDGLCFRGPRGSARLCERVDVGPNSFHATASGLLEGEGLTGVVAFAPGSVQVPPPILVERWTIQRALTGSPAAIPLTVLTSLLALGGVALLAYRQGRDRVSRGGVTVDGHIDTTEPPRRRRLFEPWPVAVQFRPPGDLRPGQLGVLIDERVDSVDVSATIVDLAVRGHLQITELSARRLFGSRTDWLLRETKNPDDPLLAYEQRLLSGLFDLRSEVKVSELKGTFAEDYQAVVKALYDDAVTRGWFPSNPSHVRVIWAVLGLAVAVGGGALLVVAALFTTVALAAVPLIVAGLLLVALRRHMPHRTPKGSRRLVETLGFREFIVTAEAGPADFAESEQMFTAYLPYAVVFGAVDRWAARFAELGVAAAAAAGTWYVGSGRDLSGLTSGLSSFSSGIGSSLSAAPPSSSGSSGFSGGSSGGGGGGGGGGSW
jgi:uncharacterized membrane protein YgcG